MLNYNENENESHRFKNTWSKTPTAKTSISFPFQLIKTCTGLNKRKIINIIF